MSNIKNAIEIIEKFNAKVSNPEEILRTLESVIDEINFPRRKLHKGSRIMRCRKLQSLNQRFSFPSELSYRIDIKNITDFGRANLPHNSKFYGTIDLDDDPNKLTDYLTAVFETSILTRNRPYGEVLYNGLEFYQIGHWVLNDDLESLLIVPTEENSKKSKANTEIYEIYKKYASIKGLSSETQKLFHLIGNEFSKIVEGDCNEYMISAILSHIYLDNKKIDSIVYPSVQADGMGHNIVLNPIMAEKSLTFMGAFIYAIIMVKKKPIVFPVLRSDSVEGLPLNWKEIPNQPPIITVFEKLVAEGLTDKELWECFLNQIFNSGPFKI